MPKVLKELEELMSLVNIYIKEKSIVCTLIESILEYIVYILHCMGI